MAKFTVKYRNKSGQIDFTEVDAANRAAVFPVLKERGITPIMISEGAMPKKRASGTSSPHSSFGFIVIIFILIAVLGGLAWWLFFRCSTKPAPSTNHQALSTNHQAPSTNHPAPAPTAKHQAPGTSSPAPSTDHQAQSTPSPAAPVRRVITNQLNFAKSRYDVFKHNCERELAFLACVPVGTLIIGDREFDEEFMKDLEASMKEPIEIKDDDPEDIKYYKQSVIDLKKQLAEMKANGEDIAKALSESRKELQKLGVYKLELEQQIDKARAEFGDDMTADEVEKFIAAANELLEKKGIEPFAFSKLSCSIMQRLPFPTPEQAAEEEAELNAEPEPEEGEETPAE